VGDAAIRARDLQLGSPRAEAGPARPGVGPHATLRELRIDDASAAAALHVQALGHTFFAALGARFLRTYWRALASSPGGLGRVAVDRDGVTLGIVAGTVDPWRQRRAIVRRHGARLASLGLLALLRQPAQSVRFARTRGPRYVRGVRRYLGWARPHRHQVPPAEPRRIGVLLHIMVSPSARRQGVGGQLASAFVEAAEESGIDQLHLVTQAGPDGASSFWRRLGWVSQGVGQDADGRRVERFARALGSGTSDGFSDASDGATEAA
jgi:ribosomal protein S18 acetylase RimI-like enzyme